MILFFAGVILAGVIYCVGAAVIIVFVEEPDLPPYPAPGWGQSHIHVVTEEEPW